MPRAGLDNFRGKRKRIYITWVRSWNHMHSLRIPLLILLCAASVFAQPGQANRDGQSATPTVPKQGISTATTRHAGLETRAGGKIPPDAPVLILERPCDQPRKGTRQSDCNSVVTRAEVDSLLDVL